MSYELALKAYEQAKDRLEEYVNQEPPAHGDRLAPNPGARQQEVERLRHAVDMAEAAYQHAKAEHDTPERIPE
jgi:hypothetical protein